MPLEFVLSQQGKRHLLHNGHLYRFNVVVSGGRRSWRCVNCSKSKCSAFIHTDSEDTIIVREKGPHNHVASAAKVAAKVAIESLRQRARESLESPHEIIANVTAGLSEAVAGQMPSISSLKRTAQRARQLESDALLLPKSLLDLEIPDRYTTTLAGQPFLLHDSGPGNDRIVIFGSLDMLVQSQHWYCDGTFKIAPPLFSQLYTLHGICCDAAFPALYALLPDKSQETYQRLFAQLRNLEPNLNPSSIMTDFELASMDAFAAEFPRAHQRGCFFHFSQCMWRKMQDVGLSRQYEMDASFAMFAKMLLCLAFVPTHDVFEAFNVMTQNDCLPVELDPIVDYIEDEWIGRQRGTRRRIPTHPIEIWNCYDAVLEGLAKTNIWCEEWHRGFLRLAASKQPSVWNFIEYLQKDHSINEVKIEQCVSGRPPLKKRCRNCSEEITRMVGCYSDEWKSEGEHPMLIDYLRGLSDNFDF